MTKNNAKFYKLSTIFRSTAAIVFLVTIAVTIVAQIITNNFYTAYNMTTLLRTASFTLMVGFAQTFVLLLGGIDLSIAGCGGLCSMIFASFVTKTTMNPYLAIILAICCGIGFGLVNGLIVISMDLTPFIVTLATSSIMTGLIYLFTKGFALTGIPEQVTRIGQKSLFGFLPYPFLIALILALILMFILKYTPFGRHIYAVGGNRSAAKIVGIHVKRVELLCYTIAGGISAMAGVLMVCRMGSYQADIGSGWTMPSVTAAVLGGTAMTGGEGGIGGTIFGGLLMSVITYSISLMGIDSYWNEVVTGIVVLIAVYADAIRRKKRKI
jgi:ribose transport system permease protein